MCIHNGKELVHFEQWECIIKSDSNNLYENKFKQQS